MGFSTWEGCFQYLKKKFLGQMSSWQIYQWANVSAGKYPPPTTKKDDHIMVPTPQNEIV
jgi:hypothetical protein